MKKSVFTILIFFQIIIILAQKSEKVKICGKYTYDAPENVTIEQAKHIALERAKAQAIAGKFSTNIMSNTNFIQKEEKGVYEDNFFKFIASEEKAEWVETIGEPKYEIKYVAPHQVVTVSVCGYAIEIKSAGVDFKVKLLRNGTEERHEGYDFKHKDDYFLSFSSPVYGYLAVYLQDYSTVYCLLPYETDPSGKVAIKAGKNYIFFSEKHADPSEKKFVEEYFFTCEKPLEINIMHIIFSTNEFTKASDNSTDAALPRELSTSDFEIWLSKNMQRDVNMKRVQKMITIKK